MTAENPQAGIVFQAVKSSLEYSDHLWYRYTLKKDYCGCTLTENEERDVLTQAEQTATAMAKQMTERYGVLAPEELLKILGLKLEHTDVEFPDSYLVMGLFDPDTRTVMLNDRTILSVRQFIMDNDLNDLTPADDLLRVAIFHEIFHALEEDTPDIYTRSRMLKRKVLGIFPYMRGLNGVSEVGAVHFSKCMSHISYSPCIYERFLLLAKGQISIDFLLPTV